MPAQQQHISANLATRMKAVGMGICAIVLSFILSLFIVIYFIKRIFFLKKDGFDHNVFDFLRRVVSDPLTGFMEWFTLFGSQYFLVPAYLLLMAYFFFVKKNTWLGIKIAAVSLSSLLLMFSLKLLFQRPRPMMPLLKEVEGLSFPSGHAFMSFSFFGLLIYIIHKSKMLRWKKAALTILFAVIILLIGISRIYLRVHYATDVITGFCMGFMWMVISLTILRFIQKRWSRNSSKITNVTGG